MTLPTAAEVTTWYLYGQAETPVNKLDGYLLRPSGVVSTFPTVNSSEFMSTGAGRFAVGAQFGLVENFFSDTSVLAPGVYTKAQVGAAFNMSFYGWNMKQIQWQDDTDDYAERVYIWNSMAFQISDEATFTVHADGTRSIENFYVIPRDDVQENFDFGSDDGLTQALNIPLKNIVDPSGIGRKVDIDFTGSPTPVTYTFADYNVDLSTISGWTYNLIADADKLGVDGATLVNDLWDAGVTKFLDAQGRPILYGTVGDDILNADSTNIILDLISNAFGISNISQYRKNGVALVGGEGDDTITGVSNTRDILFGGMDDDMLIASSWWSGLQGDTYHGGSDAIVDRSTDGMDTVSYNNVGFSVTLGFGGFTGKDGIIHKTGKAEGDRAEDTLISIENYILTKQSDVVEINVMQSLNLYGNLGTDVLDFSGMLSGGASIDVFHGQASGGGGNLIIFTNFGEFIGTDLVDSGDVFWGSTLGAIYRGGAGVDLLDYGFITTGRLDIDLRTGDVNKIGGNVVDKVYDIEAFAGSERGDVFHSVEGATGIEFHGNGQASYERDVLDFSHYEDKVTVDLGSGDVTDTMSGSMIVSDIEEVIGTGWNDTIAGSDAYGEWLYGGESYDTIYGNGGDDRIFGGKGYDNLYGGSGNDVYYIKGGEGVDNIVDSSGENDTIFLAGSLKFSGVDMVTLDNNGDAVIDDVATFTDDIETLEFADTSSFLVENLMRVVPLVYIPISSGELGEHIIGSDYDDDLSGTADNDSFSWSFGNDNLDGKGGHDSVSYHGLNDKITMFDSDGVHYIHTIVYEGGEPVLDSDGYQVIDNNGDPVFYNAGDTSTIEFNDTLSYIEEITGTQFDDTLHGDNENNVINGGAGDNIISGGGGHDTLTGNGELNGGDGHDWLNGYGELNGGNGYDTLIGSGTLHGGEGDDFLSGTGQLYGGSGHDWLYGDGILSGGSGSDHLDGSGTLIGGSGQDFLIASEDGTVLDGGSDNDSLDGNGKNSVTYVAKGGIDVINDNGSGFLFMDGNASSAKYEHAENGSLVITSGGSTAVIIQAQIGGISFNDGISFVNVPLDGTSFVENEFDQNFIGTFGGDVYTASQGTEDSLSLLGNDTFNFDAFTLYNHKSTIGVYDLSSIGGLIVINNGILQDFDVTRDVRTDSLGGYSLNLQYGENNYIELNGDTNDISQSLDVVLEDGTYDLSSFQVTTYGSPGDDSTGTMDPIADKIFGDVEGFSTDDIIYAGFGNDEVEGGLGNDIIYGEHGDDIIDGGDGDDTLYGGAGNDTLRGGDGDDTFIDSDGDDIYRVGNGDIVHLSSGNNEIIVTSTELSGVTIDLSDFEDIENDGTGLARDFSGNSSGYNYKLLYGGNSVDIRDIIKQDNAPIIKFSDGSAATLNTPLITGFGSDDADQYSENTAQINDLIYAGGGNDVFSMWYGNDTVYGGEGDDQIRAITISEDSPNSSGHLTAYGEAGNDSLGGGIGNDSLYGGDGNDIIEDISGGDNELFGGAGDDFFLLAWDGGDTVDGGEGIDTVAMSFANQNAPTEYDYEIDLENQTITSGGGTHELTSIENALGSEQDDTLIGNDQDNVLGGGAGNDTLHGGAGDDIYYISGSIDVSGVSIPSGDDNVIDVDGADTILLSEVDSIGAVTLLEEGTNLRINIAGGGSVVVTGQLSGVAELQVENLELSDGTIYDLVNYSSWYVDGDEGGSDPAPVPIVATAAPDFIIGTPITIDTADFSYSLDAVTIDLLNGFSAGGYAQGDILLFIDNIIGSALNDILTGSAGNNVLTGGAGDDVLNGGDGDDTYMFSLGDGNNTITDTSGFDVIQVESGITFDDITFTQMGNDLDIQIASGFLIKDFYAGNVVEEIRFDDGTSFDLTTLLSSDDTFVGTSAAEVFDGGAGIDTVDYSASTSRVLVNLATGLGELNDAAGDTYISVENVIGTNNSFDHLYGNAANNHLQALDGEDRLYGSSGVDIMDGGAGDGDTVYYSGSSSAVDVDLLRVSQIGGDAGGDVLVNVERVSGSIYYDTLKGDNDNNRLYGKDGDDVLDGRDGDDRLYGGNDRDIISGGSGNDELFGDDGNDVLSGGIGSDDLDGGAGFDKAVFDDVYSNYTITATDVTDNVGTGGVDTIVNIERLVFADGYYEDSVFTVNLAPIAKNDSFTANEGTLITGNLLVDNGNGVDSDPDGDALNVIADTYLTSNGSVVIASEGSVIVSSDGSFAYMANIGYSGTDSFVYTLQDAKGGTVRGSVDLNIVSLTSTINDVFVGTSALDSFDGGVGVDTVDYSASTARVRVNLDTGIGGAGDANGDTYISIENIIGTNFIYDELYGDSGTNHIQALDGEDRLYGSGGADIMDGGEGSDIIYYRLSGSAVDVDLLRITQIGGYAEGDVLLNIQYVAGSNYDDVLKGDHEYNKLYGKDGNDTLYGRDGDDKLYGGNDHDILYGGEGSDYLYGNAGDDVLYGGLGVDMLYGQSGADTFVFESSSAFSASDNIQDFDLSEGDKLDVSDLISGYDPLTDAISDFVQITESGSNSYLSVDADGGADNFVQVAYIYNATGLTDEEALETSGNLIAA